MGESITVVSKEIPECLAKSCDLSNWETDKGQIFDDSAGELETAFSELGIYCRINNASSAGKVTGVLTLALTSATTAIVFF